MSESRGTFCTVINCMDGRTQEPAIAFLRNHFNVDYVDTITEPGPVRIMADNAPAALAQSIVSRLRISIDKHKSRGVAIVIHHDCAGDPLSKEQQVLELERARAWLAPHCGSLPQLALWIGPDRKVEIIPQ